MWLPIAITAYLINAGVYVADKFLLSKKIHSSIVYAFFVGIWSIFNGVLLIFEPSVPNLHNLILDFLAGLLFLFTLVFWYKALHQSEATRVVPIVGALIPIFSLILSFAFLGEYLGQKQLLAFVVLICGGILISIKQTKFYQYAELKERLKIVFGNMLGRVHAHYRPTQRLIINSIVSAILFASYYVLIKYVYIHQPFIEGFVWSRFGSFLGAVIIILVPMWRKQIIKYQKTAKKPKNLGFFIFIRLLAGIAFILLNLAISLSNNVALVNALQGIQYVFLFFIILFLSKKHPHILKEEIGGGVLVQKIIGIVLICTGLYMLIS